MSTINFESMIILHTHTHTHNIVLKTIQGGNKAWKNRRKKERYLSFLYCYG